MTNRKTTRRALFMSVISLMLCCAMLVGTTFAWFTDEVTSVNNIIKAGNLDVELYYKNGANGSYAAVGSDPLFSSSLWEPGHVEMVNLKVSNLGTLALKYQLNVSVINEKGGINKAGEDFLLSDYIRYAVLDGDNYATREAAVAAAGQGTAVNGLNWTESGTLYPKADAAAKQEKESYVTLVVWMPENVGNEANYKTGTNAPEITLGINLYATQVENENDSFGKDYDEDAWVDGFDVYTEQDLNAAIANGETAIDLMADIALTETLEIPVGTTLSLNLNGKTLSSGVGRDADGNRVHVIVNNGNLKLVNGTVTSAGENGGSAIYNAEGASLTIEGVTVNGAPIVGTEKWPSYGINNYGTLTVKSATVKTYHGGIATCGDAVTVIYDATIDVGQGTQTKQTSWALYVTDNGELTVHNGVIKNTKDEKSQVYGGGYICATSSKNTVINGGIFDKTEGDNNGSGFYYNNTNLVINGGTFDADPSAYVASGYKAVENNGKYVVVSNEVEEVVSTPAQLEKALTDAAAAGAGDTDIVLTGDIDMTGTAWTPIEVDGYNGAGIVTIEGNGATIKGLTAPLFAGGFAGKSGIVIKNLTIADSNIVSTSGLGGGAFVDTADSMQVVTLENCHVVNSTVTGERTGGLIGWVSGYANLNDGPVKTYVTITNCSVIDSKVIGAGSAGAIAGHPGASDYTYTTIENCVVKNVDVISNDTDSWRTGAVVGTANNGHIVINNVTVENVTLTQNGVTAEETKLYGRFVPSGTGTLVIDGAQVVSTAADLTAAVANGKITLDQDINLSKIDLTDAITNDVVIDANGHKITTTDSYGIEVTAGKNITISNAEVEMTKEGDYITYAAGFKIANGDYAGSTITLKNCTITMANTDWAYTVTMPASVKNLNLVIDNCTLEGAVAVQCWGDNNKITITNSKLICNYTTSELYTSYCVVLQDDGTNKAENNTLVIDNCEFLYSGIDNFNSTIYSVQDRGKGATGNTVTVTNCTYGEKVAAY